MENKIVNWCSRMSRFTSSHLGGTYQPLEEENVTPPVEIQLLYHKQNVGRALTCAKAHRQDPIRGFYCSVSIIKMSYLIGHSTHFKPVASRPPNAPASELADTKRPIRNRSSCRL